MNLEEYLVSKGEINSSNIRHIVENVQNLMIYVYDRTDTEELGDFMSSIVKSSILIPNPLSDYSNIPEKTAPYLATISLCFLIETLKKHAELVQAFLASPTISIPPEDDLSTSDNRERSPEL